MVLATFQHLEHFTALSAGRYARLARRSPLVAALGVGMPSAPVGAVRGGTLSRKDPLSVEWNVVVVGPHFAGALLAREVPDQQAPRDADRLFEHVVTFDRDLVVQAAQSLLHRLVASD